MDVNICKIKYLLESKRNKLEEILKITKKVKLTSTEDSMEDYVNLINMRKPILNNVLQIDILLKKIEFSSKSRNMSLPDDLKKMIFEIEKFVDDIIKLDNKNKIYAMGMMDDIRKNLKEINSGKILALHYRPRFLFDVYYFDKQK